MSLLMIHAGGHRLPYEELEILETPRSTDTHCPIPHFEFVKQVKLSLGNGFEITEEEHAVSHGDQRYFGALSLKGPETDFGLVLGLRNSHDKTFPAGLALGSRVFVCDNLAFSSEVVLKRKHTSQIKAALPGLVARTVALAAERFAGVGRQIEAYKDRELTDGQAYELIIRALAAKALTATAIPAVYEQWHEPKHEEFAPRTLWSLFNAVTEGYKGISPEVAWPRSQRLHGLCDTLVGLNTIRDAEVR